MKDPIHLTLKLILLATVSSVNGFFWSLKTSNELVYIFVVVFALDRECVVYHKY
jgi:hypothetical protein